jgi:integrase/recombinase XerD
VRNKIEVHNYQRRLEGVLKRISESPIDKQDKSLILDFMNDCLSRSLSKARVVKYLDTIERIAKLLGKSFKKVTKEDISRLVREIEEKDYTDWTKHDYKLILKIFFRWFKKTEEYPEEVKWIRLKVGKGHLLPEEILTEDEVKRLAECATSLRDKAFILILYESGCRIGEILSLRIRNVQFDNYGAVLIVSGKTGAKDCANQAYFWIIKWCSGPDLNRRTPTGKDGLCLHVSGK